MRFTEINALNEGRTNLYDKSVKDIVDWFRKESSTEKAKEAIALYLYHAERKYSKDKLNNVYVAQRILGLPPIKDDKTELKTELKTEPKDSKTEELEKKKRGRPVGWRKDKTGNTDNKEKETIKDIFDKVKVEPDKPREIQVSEITSKKSLTSSNLEKYFEKIKKPVIGDTVVIPENKSFKLEITAITDKYISTKLYNGLSVKNLDLFTLVGWKGINDKSDGKAIEPVDIDKKTRKKRIPKEKEPLEPQIINMNDIYWINHKQIRRYFESKKEPVIGDIISYSNGRKSMKLIKITDKELTFDTGDEYKKIIDTVKGWKGNKIVPKIIEPTEKNSSKIIIFPDFKRSKIEKYFEKNKPEIGNICRRTEDSKYGYKITKITDVNIVMEPEDEKLKGQYNLYTDKGWSGGKALETLKSFQPEVKKHFSTRAEGEKWMKEKLANNVYYTGHRPWGTECSEPEILDQMNVFKEEITDFEKRYDVEFPKLNAIYITNAPRGRAHLVKFENASLCLGNKWGPKVWAYQEKYDASEKAKHNGRWNFIKEELHRRVTLRHEYAHIIDATFGLTRSTEFSELMKKLREKNFYYKDVSQYANRKGSKEFFADSFSHYTSVFYGTDKFPQKYPEELEKFLDNAIEKLKNYKTNKNDEPVKNKYGFD